MKRVVFFTAMLLMCSCEEPNVKTSETNFKLGSGAKKIAIVEIDGCEYLWGNWGYSTVLTHKGNCKFCAKRSNQIIS